MLEGRTNNKSVVFFVRISGASDCVRLVRLSCIGSIVEQLYSTANDPRPQMISRPQMIPIIHSNYQNKCSRW